METFSLMWSKDLKTAIINASDGEHYQMSLVSDDAQAVEAAVNQGIDAHLEACFIPDRGDSYEWKQDKSWCIARLHCHVSPESLTVLVRRLLESGNEEAEMLASSICDTLDIELI